MKIALQALMITKQTYYYEPEPQRDQRCKALDPALESLLKQLQGYELVYGYRKVTNMLKTFNHKKVYRHMRTLDMLQPKKIKKQRHARLGISCPIKANVRWEGDLTYVWDGHKLNYLFVIVDAYDKEPIGDYYGLRCRADEAIMSLEEAVMNRFGNLEPWPEHKESRVSLRVDQGSQYIARKFKDRARALGVKLEYCGIDCPDDKPYVECFFARYKCEEVYHNEYRSYVQAFLSWIQYKQWYRTQRIHQGLGYKTIPEFKQRALLLPALLESKNIGA